MGVSLATVASKPVFQPPPNRLPAVAIHLKLF